MATVVRRAAAPAERPRVASAAAREWEGYLGVGIGEHLGYLATGLWTILIAASIASSALVPGWMAIVGVVIGIALLVGTLEFVGPNEPHGWELAGTIVPIAYIAWSIWLVALGVLLLVG